MTSLHVLHCLDAADTAALREAHRDAHAAYMKAHAAHVVLGGPLLAADGTTRIGVMAVLRFDDAAALAHFVHHEPYRQAGVFERVSLHPMQVVMQSPL